MSTTLVFEASGWARAVLMGDSRALAGVVEIRAWREWHETTRAEPDFLAFVRGRELRYPSKPRDLGWEHLDLMFAAGRAIATARLGSAVFDAVEGFGG